MTTLKLTRYSEKDLGDCAIRKMDAAIGKLGRVLEEPVYGNEEAWREYIREIIAFQDHENGGFPLLDTYRIEADCRVEYCHKPTYLCSAILMKALVENADLLTGKEDCILPGALKMCCARGLKGQGFDDIRGQLEAMEIFHRGHVRQFLEKYSGLCPEFAEMIRGIIRQYRQFIETETFMFGFGENHEYGIRKAINNYEKEYVFVYGTLMEGQYNYQRYLYPEKPIAHGCINGYIVLDLGAYPGIVQGQGTVKGEVFEIPCSKLPELDRLESNGSLYDRVWTTVYIEKSKSLPAYVYVYKNQQ